MLRQIILRPHERSEMGRAVMLGMNFGVGMAVFSFTGYYLDQRRGGGSMLFTILGLLAGLGYGAYEVWIVIRLLNEQARKAMENQERDGVQDAGRED